MQAIEGQTLDQQIAENLGFKVRTTLGEINNLKLDTCELNRQKNNIQISFNGHFYLLQSDKIINLENKEDAKFEELKLINSLLKGALEIRQRKQAIKLGCCSCWGAQEQKRKIEEETRDYIASDANFEELCLKKEKQIEVNQLLEEIPRPDSGTMTIDTGRASSLSITPITPSPAKETRGRKVSFVDIQGGNISPMTRRPSPIARETSPSLAVLLASIKEGKSMPTSSGFTLYIK